MAAEMQPSPPRSSQRSAADTWRRTRPFVFLLVPIVALWELVAHAWIVTHVPTDSQWRQAHDFIARERRAGELVASAPLWTDPLARMYFADLITLRDAARADASAYPRAWVATVRGGENPDFRGWSEERRQRFGEVTVRVLRNPSPATVAYDFLEHLRPPEARVTRGDRECPFRSNVHTGGGGLGQGALPGSEQFMCGEPWNYVGRTIAEDMDHRGRLCIWSHPVVEAPMRTTFQNVPIGSKIRGHHVVAYEAERGGDHGETGAPITLTVYVGDQVVGRDTHTDGEGWKLFEFDTSGLRGTTSAVTFEVTVPSGGNRHYCFQADAR
jgi:hypothetical protein